MNPNRRSRSRHRARKRRSTPIHRAAPFELPAGDMLQVPRAVAREGRRSAKGAAFPWGDSLLRLGTHPTDVVHSSPEVRFVEWSLVDASNDPTLPRIGETGEEFSDRQRELRAAR